MIPYFQNENIILYHGDCLEVMPTLPRVVDMCITDLPYGKLKGRNHCDWDNVIPFEPMWNKLTEIVKPQKAILLFGQEPFASALRLSNVQMYKYDWYWNKKSTSGFMNAKYLPMKTMETISVFSTGKTNHGSIRENMVYFPQGLVSCNRVAKNGNKTDGAFCVPSWKDGEEYIQTQTGYPRNYIECGYQKMAQHPTQKPVALIEYLVRTYTQENEVVLDFACGSGTTAIACINSNRKCILIEKEERYCEMSARRIEERINGR